MSTGLECEVIEIKKGIWFYILENCHDDWFQDWRENSTAYGPFPDCDSASLAIRKNHCSPGGQWTTALGENELELDLEKDPVLKKLIQNAKQPRFR